MKKTLSTIWGVLVILGIAATAQADDIQLGTPSYGGTGCPAGSASAVLSPDQKTLSILFDQYVAEAGGVTGKRIDRKNCNIAIPVHVPQGLSISLIAVDYRGYTFVPQGGNARFSVEYFFAGRRGPRTVKNFFGPEDSDYLVSDHLIAEGVVWSPCGIDTNLRVNSSMTAQSNYYGEDVLATVDTADIEAGIIYQIQWRRCY